MKKIIYEEIYPETKKGEYFKFQIRDSKGQFTDNDKLSSREKPFTEEIADSGIPESNKTFVKNTVKKSNKK